MCYAAAPEQWRTLRYILHWFLFTAPYQAANAVGYATGTAISFVLNRAVTYKTYDAPWRRFAMFSAVALTGFTLSLITLYLLIDRAHVHPIIAKLISLVIVLIVQFSLNSLLTFRRSTTERDTVIDAGK